MASDKDKKASEAREKTRGYRKSRARLLIHQDVADGTIPADMPVEQAFASRPEFAEYDGERLFPSRLASSRKQHVAKTERSQSELQALHHDRQIFPRPALTHWGEPQWEGSTAQSLLMKDVLEDRVHERMKPQEIWKSRDAYSLFDKDRFREKIYQVQRTDKFNKHMRAKNEKKKKAKK